MSISPARTAAFDILMRIDRTDAYAAELLHAPQYSQLSQKDHGLATELVMGVLRWRSVLDEQITPVLVPKIAETGCGSFDRAAPGCISNPVSHPRSPSGRRPRKCGIDKASKKAFSSITGKRNPAQVSGSQAQRQIFGRKLLSSRVADRTMDASVRSECCKANLRIQPIRP